MAHRRMIYTRCNGFRIRLVHGDQPLWMVDTKWGPATFLTLDEAAKWAMHTSADHRTDNLPR